MKVVSKRLKIGNKDVNDTNNKKFKKSLNTISKPNNILASVFLIINFFYTLFTKWENDLQADTTRTKMGIKKFTNNGAPLLFRRIINFSDSFINFSFN